MKDAARVRGRTKNFCQNRNQIQVRSDEYRLQFKLGLGMRKAIGIMSGTDKDDV